MLSIDVGAVRGFLPLEEAQCLHEVALQAASLGPILEIGSYCGRSTLVLAAACRAADSVVFAVDHHRGSEEHQPGEMFHDAALCAADGAGVDSWPEFRANMDRSGLAPWVIPIVQRAERLARFWRQPLAMLFLDGGHSLDQALADYRGWSGQLLAGGFLAIHDVFNSAAAGGQAPQAVAALALQSGLFAEYRRCGSLLVLQRL